MKNKKKMTTIAASLAMMFVSAVLLGAGTFAWFTRGTEAQATGFNFTASAATGMQISTTGVIGTFKSSLLATDFVVDSGPQQGNRVTLQNMEPVSTANSVTGGALSFFGATSGDGNFTVGADSANYLMFDLYFFNEGIDVLTLMLDRTSSVVDGAVDKNTSLSTRVAFINQGSAEPANIATLQAQKAGTSAYIWEPNSLYRSGTAINEGAENNAKYSYYGMTGTGLMTNIDQYGLIDSTATKNVKVSNTHDLAIGDDNIVTTLAAGHVTKVTIYVWIEGQDVDCDNGTSAGDVIINLMFDSASSTGAAQRVVNTLTPTGIAGDVVSLSGTSYAGATYYAFVLSDNTDSVNSNLDYQKLEASGSASAIDNTLSSITVDAAMNGNLVVVGYYTGGVSARATN